MGLLTGGLVGRRFRVCTDLPANFRDLFRDALREHGFVPDLDANDAEPRVGWVHAFDPGATAFELNDWLIDRYVAVTLRSDKKAVQGAFFKIAMARRVAAVCEERGIESLSKGELEAVKDALHADLMRRALPTVATTDVAWDIHTGEVLVFSTSATALEHVRVLMSDTFGVALQPERVVDWVTDKIERDELSERMRHLGGPDARDGGGDDPLEPYAFELGSDFLTWLWLQSEASDGLFRVIDGSGAQQAALAKLDPANDDIDDEWNDITESLRHSDLTLWIDHRLKLQELFMEAPETTILIGESPSASDEARANLERGKRPVEAQLGLKLHDLECSMVLCATPEGVQLKSLKVPTVVKTGTDEKLLERMFLVDLVHTTLKQLFQQFFLVRTSPAWQPRVDRWISEDLAAK